MEASGFLVGPPVFKTGEAEYLGLAGSIPVRLRHTLVPATDGGAMPGPDDPRRRIPTLDAVLSAPEVEAHLAAFGPAGAKALVRQVQARARSSALAPEDVVGTVASRLADGPVTLRRTINATGIVVHTNLGRAPLSAAALRAIDTTAGYVDVEFDLATGARSRRGAPTLAALLDAVPAAGGAHVVNNGAAALVLVTTALAAGKEVVVSRGELVEIGDGFRLTDLIASTGARIREVGTTNRTHLADYTAAVGPQTGCILKVHPSNFRVQGFTTDVGVGELAGLGVPVVNDIGSGLLTPDPLISDEPDADTALRAGATLVTASGDKLLGGPQAGLMLGDADLVERLRKHPLARALRVDKLTLAALEATLRGPVPPVTRYLHARADELRTRTDAFAAAVGAGEVLAVNGHVGGGGAPGVPLPGWALALPEVVALRLRAGEPPVVARVDGGRCLVDLRCVEPDDEQTLVAAVRTALED